MATKQLPIALDREGDLVTSSRKVPNYRDQRVARTTGKIVSALAEKCQVIH